MPIPSTNFPSTGWRPRRASSARRPRGSKPDTPSRVLLINGSPRNDGTCPGEISKTCRLLQLAREVLEAQQHRSRRAGPEPAHLRIRPPDPSLQRLRLHRHAAVPLALQLLPQPFAAPDRRLDERDLRTLGRRPRRDHLHADPLVPGHQPAQADGRPPGLRRRRQSRPHLHPRQEGRRSQGDRTQGLGLPQAPGGPRLRRGGARRRGRRREPAPQSQRLARLDGPDRRRHPGAAGPLHRLLRALRHQPRGARRTTRRAGRSAQRRARGRPGGGRSCAPAGSSRRTPASSARGRSRGRAETPRHFSLRALTLRSRRRHRALPHLPHLPAVSGGLLRKEALS